jgi:hypothetical protein
MTPFSRRKRSIGRLPAEAWLLAGDVAYCARPLPSSLALVRARRDHLARIHRLERERVSAACRLDLRTCDRWWQYVDVLDPYGDDPDPHRETCIGRWYFVADPDDGISVEEHLAREQPDEWRQLMDTAGRRSYESGHIAAR